MSSSEVPIASVRWRPWRIPFRDEFRTGTTSFRVREGFVIEFQDANGLTGIGEASPLQEYAGGSLEAVASALSQGLPSLISLTPTSALLIDAKGQADPASAAAIRCGLETASMDLGARQTKTAGAAWLASVLQLDAPAPTSEMPVNGTLDAAAPEEAIARACSLVGDGFTTLKVKVGGSVTDDIERIEAIRGAVGDRVELRIDANGGWSVESARRVLSAAEAIGVSLCEQPLSPDDADVLALTAALRIEFGVPIALDESCRSLSDVVAVIASNAADAIVVKPMITGLREAARMLEAATTAGLTCIVTTTFDTSVGTATAAQLAALLPEPRQACGLATVSLLAGDLVDEPIAIRSGVLLLREADGLGVALDEGALENWATGPWSQA